MDAPAIPSRARSQSGQTARSGLTPRAAAAAVAPVEVLEDAPQTPVPHDRALRPLPGGRVPGGSAPGGPKPRHLARVLAVGLFALVALCMFAVVGVHALLTQNQFRLDGLQQQLAKVSARHQQLEEEVGQLLAPERIISAAEHELGLVLPASVTYVAPTTATTTPATSSPGATGTTTPTTTSPPTTSRNHTASRPRER